MRSETSRLRATSTYGLGGVVGSVAPETGHVMGHPVHRTQPDEDVDAPCHPPQPLPLLSRRRDPSRSARPGQSSLRTRLADGEREPPPAPLHPLAASTTTGRNHAGRSANCSPAVKITPLSITTVSRVPPTVTTALAPARNLHARAHNAPVPSGRNGSRTLLTPPDHRTTKMSRPRRRNRASVPPKRLPNRGSSAGPASPHCRRWCRRGRRTARFRAPAGHR